MTPKRKSVAQNPQDGKWYVIYQGRPVSKPFDSEEEAGKEEYRLMTIQQMGEPDKSLKTKGKGSMTTRQKAGSDGFNTGDRVITPDGPGEIVNIPVGPYKGKITVHLDTGWEKVYLPEQLTHTAASKKSLKIKEKGSQAYGEGQNDYGIGYSNSYDEGTQEARDYDQGYADALESESGGFGKSSKIKEVKKKLSWRLDPDSDPGSTGNMYLARGSEYTYSIEPGWQGAPYELLVEGDVVFHGTIEACKAEAEKWESGKN